MNAQHLVGCTKIHTLPEELVLSLFIHYWYSSAIPTKVHGFIVYVLTFEILTPNPQRYLTH